MPGCVKHMRWAHAQVIAQHEAVGGARGRGADLLGFATAPARRRNEAKARMLLACWMAETGQGYRGDIESEPHPFPAARCCACALSAVCHLAAGSGHQHANT